MIHAGRATRAGVAGTLYLLLCIAGVSTTLSVRPASAQDDLDELLGATSEEDTQQSDETAKSEATTAAGVQGEAPTDTGEPSSRTDPAAPGESLPTVPVKTAEAPAPVPAPARNRPAQIEEIVVTAQKNASSVQDLPLAVSAISGKDLAMRGVGGVADLQYQVPSLNYSERSGVVLVTIRGVGNNVDTGFAEPAVASHVNGAYQPRASTGALGMADVARIEVLRGPQGTLYGRNATGGAINYILNEPTDTFEARVTAGAGTLQNGKLVGVVSGPLVDDVLNGRVVVDIDRQNGYVEELERGRELGASRSAEGRVALQLFPGDDLSMSLDLLYRDDRHLDPNFVLVNPPKPELEARLGIVPPTQSNPDDYTLGDYHKVKNNFYNEGQRDTSNGILKVDWDMGWASLKSLTGLQDHQIVRSYDQDATRRDIFHVINFFEDSRSFSQELNLQGVPDWGRWIIGAYYFREDYFINIPIEIPAAAAGAGLGIDLFGQYDIQAQALFADATLDISSRLRAFGGLRYSEDKKELTQTVRLFAGGLDGQRLDPGNGVTCEDLHTVLRFDNLSPRYGLQFDLAEDVMVYAQQQKGYKSGDANFSTCNNTFEPERVDSIELGLKSTWFDRRLIANLALFTNKYTDFQVFKVSGTQGFVVNAPRAKINGGEIELTALPWESLTVSLNASYLDARYVEFRDTDPANPDAGEQDLAGNQLSRAPTYTLGFGLEQEILIDWWKLANLRLRGEYFRSEDVYFRPYGEDMDKQDAYSLVNAFATLLGWDDRFSLRLYGKNLTDKAYLQHVFADSIGSRVGQPAPPRSFGIDISYRFD